MMVSGFTTRFSILRVRGGSSEDAGTVPRGGLYSPRTRR